MTKRLTKVSVLFSGDALVMHRSSDIDERTNFVKPVFFPQRITDKAIAMYRSATNAVTVCIEAVTWEDVPERVILNGTGEVLVVPWNSRALR